MQKIVTIILAIVFLHLVLSASGVIELAQSASCKHLKATITKEKNSLKRRALYRQAINICPEDADLHFKYAHDLERFRKYEEALVQYNIAVQLNENLFQAFFNMGDIYRAQKQYDAAIQAYTKGLKLDPHNARAQKHLKESKDAAKK